MTDRLSTQRLLMRRPEPRDEAAYVAFYGSARRAETAPVVPADVARTRFKQTCAHWNDKGFGRFIVEEAATGDVLGMVGPHHPDDYPEAEICWHLWTDQAEGRGIAYEAAKAAQHHAFQALGWKTAVSYVYAENTRSIRLAEKLGARIDPDAPFPGAIGPHLVYRHPHPGGVS